MAKKTNGGSKRKIDENVSVAGKRLKSKFVLIPSMKIKGWKAFAVIMFAAGFSAALIWSAYNSWYLGSDAKGGQNMEALSKKNVPVILSSTPNGDLPSGTKSAELSVKTKDKSICQYGSDPSGGGKIKYAKFEKTGSLIHASVLKGLADGQNYSFSVVCQDKKSKRKSNPYQIKFSVQNKSAAGDKCMQAGNISANGSIFNGRFGKCCVGLEEIDNGAVYDPTSNSADKNGCAFMVGAGVICSACGNGTCETSWENPCNCPKDCPATMPDQIVVTKKDNGRAILVKNGATIRLILEGNGSTGYAWYPDSLDNKYLELISSQEAEPESTHEPGKVGNPSLIAWNFKVKDSGATQIKMDYFRAWEGKGKSVDHFLLKIKIE